MSVDSIGNFLTIIRNGVAVSKRTVFACYSKMNFSIAQILKNEGFIKDVVVVDSENSHKQLQITLKYYSGESVIHEIKRISKPGIRNYTAATGIQPVIGNLGISILSTNRGVITHKEAKKYGVGGEVICSVW